MSLAIIRKATRLPQYTRLACVIRAQTLRCLSTEDSAWSSAIENAPTKKIRQSLTAMTPEEKWAQASSDFLERNHYSPADAYTGRSVKVEAGDINRANRVLSGILARDGVIKEWFENRRHKQKGELRRKLVSMRWRRLFKHEVGKKVELVQQIRRRGA